MKKEQVTQLLNSHNFKSSANTECVINNFNGVQYAPKQQQQQQQHEIHLDSVRRVNANGAQPKPGREKRAALQ